jgi:hypothetical protein
MVSSTVHPPTHARRDQSAPGGQDGIPAAAVVKALLIDVDLVIYVITIRKSCGDLFEGLSEEGFVLVEADLFPYAA